MKLGPDFDPFNPPERTDVQEIETNTKIPENSVNKSSQYTDIGEFIVRGSVRMPFECTHRRPDFIRWRPDDPPSITYDENGNIIQM
jgi:hypothetical protein